MAFDLNNNVDRSSRVVFELRYNWKKKRLDTKMTGIVDAQCQDKRKALETKALQELDDRQKRTDFSIGDFNKDV